MVSLKFRHSRSLLGGWACGHDAMQGAEDCPDCPDCHRSMLEFATMLPALLLITGVVLVVGIVVSGV